MKTKTLIKGDPSVERGEFGICDILQSSGAMAKSWTEMLTGAKDALTGIGQMLVGLMALQAAWYLITLGEDGLEFALPLLEAIEKSTGLK